MNPDNILALLASLLGFGALVSIIVNVLKYFGIVKDGTSDKWVAGFNLAGFVALVVISYWFPQINIPQIDTQLGVLASLLTIVFSYVTTILGSKLTYLAVKNLPIIGKSNSG